MPQFSILHGMKLKFLALVFFALVGARTLSAQSDTVKVGTFIISVHDINFRDKEYTARFWLWFLYNNPDFDFSTQLDIPNAKSIDPAEIILDSIDGKTWAIMKMKCTMKENWKVHNFPFDKQHLKIQIENSLFDNKSLVFVPDVKGSTIDDQEAIDGWSIKNFNVSAQTNDYRTGFGDARPERSYQIFSTFQVEMDLERQAFGLFMKIFIGMYIAFLIAIISFVPHPSEFEPRFGLPVGGLFAAVGNKYIIDSLLPESSTFSLVDTLHTLTFLGIFSTLVVSAICLKLHDLGKKEACLRVNAIGSRTVIIAFVLLNALFIILALIG